MGRRKKSVAIAIGNRMRAAREMLGLQQQEVAQRLGVTVEAYGSYERGYHVLPVELLPKLGRVLGRSPLFFLGLPDEPPMGDDERLLLDIYRRIENPDIRRLVREVTQVQLGVDRQIREAATQ